MKESTQRARKLSAQIKEIVAEMLNLKIKDPRLGFITITDTRVTSDLKNVTFFYTVLGKQGDISSTKEALSSAKGMLRSEISKIIRLRLAPKIEFIYDSIPENVSRLEDVINKAAIEDRRIKKLSFNARHSGEENPYQESP